jgi:hypothetical protein
MDGFVHPRVSAYLEMLETLPASFATVWPNVPVRFYKFGSEVQPIVGETSYQAASRLSFYHGPLSKTTKISLVLTKVGPQNLTLLVTDLFQSDADVAAMISALGAVLKTSGPDLSVGLVGVKSEFDGKVYDVGPRNLSFAYRSRPHRPETYRPFYILVIGAYPIVQHYLEQLHHDSTTLSTREGDILLLSRLPYKTAISLGKMENQRLAAGMGAIPSDRFFNCRNPEIEGVMLRDKAHAIRLTGVLTEPPVSEMPALVPERETLTIRGREWQPSAGAWRDLDASVSEVMTAKFEAIPLTPPAKRAAVPDGELCSQGNRANPDDRDVPALEAGEARRLAVTLCPQHLSVLHKTYYFRLSWVADADAFQLPPWYRNWDMDTTALDGWVEHPATFDGSKTLNLRTFVEDVWRTMIDKGQPLGAIYIYAQT